MSSGPENLLFPTPNTETSFPPSAWRSQEDEEPVPTYTESDEVDFIARLTALRNSGEDLELPIERWPDVANDNPDYFGCVHSETGPDANPLLGSQIRKSIITSFFDSLRSRNTEIVTFIITANIVTPDTTNITATTPLIAAVDAGNAAMVRTLLQLGAEVNRYAIHDGKLRTPLQVAASKGNLVIVKLFMEEGGADDSLIAPDGQLALRLAVDHGHREVVDYLPARRGGEFRRWKVHHGVAVRRIKRASRKIGFALKCIFWYPLKALLYWIPKHCVVLPIRDATKWAWQNRNKFGGWCKRQITELPRRVKKVGKFAWKVTKEAPPFMVDLVRELAKAIWRFIKAVPGAVKTIGQWIWGLLKSVLKAMASMVGRGLSFVHTALSVVITFFRDLTLRDIWAGFCDFLSVIFVDIPRAIWSFLTSFGKFSYKVLGGLFGVLGKLAWWMIYGTFCLIQYIPAKVVEILSSLGGSVGKGLHEILVWFNPKR